MIMKQNNYAKEFFRNNKITTGLTILVYIGNSVLNIGVSWFLQVIMDFMAGSQQFSFTNIFTLFIAALIFAISLSVTQYLTEPKFLSRAMRQYKEATFHDLLKKDLSSFSKESTSTYISAFTNDAISIEENYLKKLFQLVQLSFMFIGAFGLMVYYNLTLTFIAIALSILPLVVSMLTGDKLVEKERVVSEQNESYVSSVKDILSGFSVVKSFQAEGEVRELFNESNHQLESSKQAKNRTMLIIEGIGSTANLIAQIGVMLAGAWLVVNQQSDLTGGMVIAFTNLMNFVIQPIAVIPQLRGLRKAAIGLIDKLAENLAHNVTDQGEDLALLNDTAPDIQVENLSYSYGEDHQALSNISFQFESGKSYAIVGASGSGKSTLLNLLMGTETDYGGAIKLNQQEVGSISSNSLYQVIAQIQQNVFIFNATIRENITMFKDFPNKQVDRVIQLSGLNQLIQSRGEDYLAGENGNKLSGGERQRVAIARALLRDSKVLLVDEATSSLDKQIAHQISQAILDLQGLTRVVITHQLDAPLLQQYDAILVLKDGELIETGTFSRLMEDKQYFYSLFVVSN